MTLLIALSKFLICPLGVAVGDVLFAGVSYAGVGQWIAVGWTLAVVSNAGDMLWLDRLGHVGSFVVDFLTATVVVWASQFVLPAATVTWGGALGTGLLLGLTEVVVHLWIQRVRAQGVRANRP